jgi:5-hydroxyisourate hydrolase-like protein (transthyretin family)
VTGFPDGDYSAQFLPSCFVQQPFADMYYEHASELADATFLHVDAASPSGTADVALLRAPRILGTLTNSDGQPIPNETVTVKDGSDPLTLSPGEQPRPDQTTTTDPNGDYVVDNVPTGSWQVMFSGSDTYADLVYDNSLAPQAFTHVPALPGQDTTGIDEVLPRWASISGTVTQQSNGEPASGVKVIVNPNRWDELSQLNTVTDANGHYALDRVEPGEYTVTFSGGDENVAPDHWMPAGQQSPRFTLVDGDHVTANQSLQPGGILTGRLLMPDGSPQTASVSIVGLNTSVNTTVNTDADGRFTFDHLGTGGYMLRYLNEYYPGAADQEDAEVIHVTAGEGTDLGDKRVLGVGTLSGSVTVEGVPVGSATVTATSASDDGFNGHTQTTTTTADGNWSMTVPPGRYTMSAHTSDTSVADRYLPSAIDPNEAQSVVVNDGDNDEPESIVLGLAGSIDGTVTTPAGAPASQACVTAWQPDDVGGIDTTATAFTDSNGNYTLSPLNPGDYTLQIDPCNAGTFGAVFHGGAVDEGAATPVRVDSGQTTQVADALLPGGRIVGVVQDAAGRPDDVEIEAVSSTGARATTQANDSGQFQFLDLDAGTWKLKFEGWCDLSQGWSWYRSALRQSEADAVDVTSGGTVDLPVQVLPGSTECDDPSSEDEAGPAPTNVTATVDGHTAAITWTPPDTSDDDIIVTGYRVVTDDQIPEDVKGVTVGPNATRAVLRGLSDGSHMITVRPIDVRSVFDQVSEASTTVEIGSAPPPPPQQVSTTTQVTGPSAVQAGQAVQYVASVTPVPDGGTVRFDVDSMATAPRDLSADGMATSPPLELSPGEHTIAADYSGTDGFTFSEGFETVEVSKAQTALAVSTTPDHLHALVTGGATNGGSMSFTVNGVEAGTAPVDSDGTADLRYTLPLGNVVTVARYSGDADNASSEASTAKRDPNIRASFAAGDPSHAGWRRRPVTVRFSCAVGSAPLTSECPHSLVLRNGVHVSRSFELVADDGGRASVSIPIFRIDGTPPQIHLSGVRNRATYGHRRHIDCRATDALSGVRSCTVRQRGMRIIRYVVVAHDVAGNERTVRGRYRVR